MSRLEHSRHAPASALLVLALALPGLARSASTSGGTPDAGVDAAVIDGGSLMGFKLTSTAFADGEAIPKKHTCDGPDL